MELSARRYATGRRACAVVPVSEYGDPDRQFGYAYDERDGTGRGPMPALAVDRRSGRPRGLPLPHVARASALPQQRAACPAGPRTRRALRRRRHAARPRAPRRAAQARRCGGLDAASERFDAWESCVSWVPVTEYGDPDGAFGYLFGCGTRSASGRRWRSTAATGTTPTTCSWPSSAATARRRRARTNRARGSTDVRLALHRRGLRAAAARRRAGGGRRTAPSVADRVEELQQELDSLDRGRRGPAGARRGVRALRQCMYLIGVSRAAAGLRCTATARRGRALALDIRGFGRPEVPVPRLPGRGAPEHRMQRGRGRGGHRRLSDPALLLNPRPAASESRHGPDFPSRPRADAPAPRG